MPNDFQRGGQLERLAERLRKPTAALEKIGAIITAAAQDAFRTQSWDGKPWKPRHVPNVMGILADLAIGKNPPARRFQDRPVLKDTGDLLRRLNWRVTSDETVDVGSPMEYASVHNYGGETESEPITLTMQSRLAKWLAKKSSEPWRPDLDWLTMPSMTGRTIKAKVPARTFVGITTTIMADIEEAVGVRIALDPKQKAAPNGKT